MSKSHVKFQKVLVIMILKWNAIVLLLAFLLWAVFVVRKINYFFDVKYKHLAHPIVHASPKYPAYTREDFARWNRTELMIGGIFLFPLRAVGFLIAVTWGWITLHILTLVFKIKDYKEEQPEMFIKLSRCVVRAACRATLFFVGFFHIPIEEKKFNPEKYPELICKKNVSSTLFVSNHVSYLDIIYFLASADTPCFVAKAETIKIPLISLYAQVIQCIFVNRESTQARLAVLNDLKERVSKLNQGRRFSKMVVFPEGTTTNGKGLISFKKGPFVLETPLKLMGLKYGGNFSPCYHLVDVIDSIFCVLSQFRNELKIIQIEGVIEPKGQMDWNVFAESVRQVMSNEFGLILTDGSYEEKIIFEKEQIKPLQKK